MMVQKGGKSIIQKYSVNYCMSFLKGLLINKFLALVDIEVSLSIYDAASAWPRTFCTHGVF